MKRSNRLQGSTLLLTVVIALTLAILCSSVILLGWYNRQQQFIQEVNERLTINIRSAVDLVLTDTITAGIERTDTTDLYGAEQDSVAITGKWWGIFNVASITAFHRSRSKRKNFIYGAALPAYMNACVYLADYQRPLLVIGDTRLTGNAYLSKAGIKAGLINQRGFPYDQLIDGKVHQSETALPALDSTVMDFLYQLAFAAEPALQEGPSTQLHPGDSLSRSFGDSVLTIAVKGHLKLENLHLQGNIIITADSSIEVMPDAQLEHIILVAPSITFRAGCQNTVQAIATDSVILEEECLFNYPSALVLIKDTNSMIQNRISIGARCRLKGIVLAYCPKRSDVQRSLVNIQGQTVIEGVLYCMGYLSPAGAIKGTVLTDHFTHSAGVAIYENHLVDVTINRLQLSRYFTGPMIFRGALNRQVIEWVN